MKLRAVSMCVWLLVGSSLVLSQGGAPPAAGEMTTPDIPGVVAGGTKIQVLATWKEGEGGEGALGLFDGTLVFTQPGLKRLAKIDKDGKMSTLVTTDPDTVLGLAYDMKGRVIGTNRGNPWGVVAWWPTRTVIADKYDGKPFGRPNDIVVDTKGGIYFTDNTGPRPGQPTPVGSAGHGVYYIKPDGQVVQLSTFLERPNGIQLSPDGKTLYVCEGMGDVVMAFDIQPDGRLGQPRPFAQLGEKPTGADGMVVDAAGRLYVGARTVRVFSPQGKPLGEIKTPKNATNLSFGGTDRKTLFVTSNAGAAYKIAMRAEGMKNRVK